ncbi:hypothetical protein Mapa_014723 [Marchantia paleacea]|nr:hypothetical protein Mapa_014723 [Marchantia paleacea]
MSSSTIICRRRLLERKTQCLSCLCMILQSHHHRKQTTSTFHFYDKYIPETNIKSASNA